MDTDPNQQPSRKGVFPVVGAIALLLAGAALVLMFLEKESSRTEIKRLALELKDLRQESAGNRVEELQEQIRLLASNHLVLSEHSITARQLSNMVNELNYSRASLGGVLDRLDGLTKTSDSPADLKSQAEKIAHLEARLGALNATPIPYSAEELQLLQADRPGVRQRDLARMAELSRDAQRAYRLGQHEDAERSYRQLLELNPDDHLTLANLGTVQMELGNLPAAEANLKKALELNGTDAKSISLMGLVKLRQQKLDEALDFLSRAATMQPSNAENHNYIGIVLSQQGHRTAAETAFRKALKLAPDYPVAHFNLAVYYITGKPPASGLARFHYEKAVKAGHPKSARVEQMLTSAR